MIKCSLFTLIVFIVLTSILLGVNMVPTNGETCRGIVVPYRSYGWPRTFYVAYDYEKFGNIETAQVSIPDAGLVPLKAIARKGDLGYEALVYDIALMLLISFSLAVGTEIVVRLGVNENE